MTGTIMIVGVLLAIGLYLLVIELLDRRPPAELRGDWWSGFEEQFRAYAGAQTNPAGAPDPRLRRRDHRLPPG